MSTRVRRAGVALALALGGLPALTAAPAAADVTVAAPSPASVVGAPDFASERYADAWDYDDLEDQRLDGNAGMLGVSNQRLESGLLRMTTHAGAAFDPVFTWPGDLAWGRDGEHQPIDAGRYTHLSMKIRASAAPAGGSGIVMWFDCPTRAPSCRGATPFALRAGWQVVDVELRNTDPGSTKAWAGAITSLRVVPGTPDGTTVDVDWVRLHRRGAPVSVAWTDSDPGNAVEVFYDTDTDAANNTPDNPGWGLVERKAASAASNTTSFNASAHPPGRYHFYAVDGARRSAHSPPLTIVAPPLPVVHEPDAAGGADYATAVRGDAWDMGQATDVARVANATGVSFSGGALHATNAGPNRNDPQVDLPLAGPIDGSRFHRLSFVYRYDGPFGLEDAPGGGTMARIIWQVAGGGPNDYQDLNDIVTYQGVNRVVVDLATNPATAVLDEDQRGTRLGWAGRQVTTLRFDPNEDPGPRTWHLDDIRLAEDDAGAGSFDIVFSDEAWAPGTTADVFVDTDARGFDGTRVATGIEVVEGRNTYRWVPSGTPPGLYHVYVVLRRGEAQGQAYSTGPVRMGAVGRLAGPDRIATAVGIGEAAYAAGTAETVVLARHDNFPDALAGTPLAAARKGPLLLTQPAGLDARVESAIRRLLPAGRTVHLLGGEGALSSAVEDRVRALGYQVRRLSGADRYETAVRIAEAIGTPSPLLLTTGTNFPDALAAGAAAAREGGAVLLTNGSTMPPATAAYLSANRAPRFAVGAPAATADPAATPLVGANRYETSRLVAERFFRDPTTVGIASGVNFPDALAGGAHAAKAGGPLLLSPREGLPEPVRRYLVEHRASLATGFLYGGEAALADAVRSGVEAAIA